MSYLVQISVVTWTNCRCGSYYNVGGQVVCPEGLNGGLKALLFDFEELPLWNAATADEPAQDPPLIKVDLSSMEPATNTTLAPPLFLAIEPPCHIATVFSLDLWGPWNSCSRLSLQPQPLSQHSMPGRKPSSAALGNPPSTTAEDPLGLKGTDSAILNLMATSSQASPHAVMPENIPSIIQVSHSSSPGSQHLPTPQSQAPPRTNPADLSDEVL